VVEASAGTAGTAGGTAAAAASPTPGVAAAAIDGDPHTLWNTINNGDTLPPHIVIDLGQSQTISGFSYLPRQDKLKEGLVTQYSFAVSDDGLTWTAIKTGEFSNIVANPLEQWVKFDQPVTSRYIRFTATGVNAGSGVAVAELGVWTR
jgi:alpha-L-fucosidase